MTSRTTSGSGDLTGGTLTRLTLDAGGDSGGVWTPDSQRVIFASTRAGLPALFWKAADGTGTTDPLGEGKGPRVPFAVAPDGSVVVVNELNEGSFNLITVSLTGEPVSEDLLVTEFTDGNAALSPNGNWVAYQSNASGVNEVYVRPFPDADSALHPISTNGGTSPVWAPDGRGLFYVDFRWPCARGARSDGPHLFAGDGDGGDGRRLPAGISAWPSCI